jgi:hypothetical protein
VGALADAYCVADAPTKEFYAFVGEWKATAIEAKIPSTTASDMLGTQTAASLYYTPTPAVTSKKPSSASHLKRNSKIALAILCTLAVLNGVSIRNQ